MRQKAKKGPQHILAQRAEAEVNETVYALARVVLDSPNPLLVDTTCDTFDFISPALWHQRWQELNFLSDLDRMPHDKYYQDIELPSGIRVSGYSKSNETWKRLSTAIDFKDKSVLDVGCFHGFFLFKASEAGARELLGIDISQPAIDVAKRIAWLRNSKALFVQADICRFRPEQRYDIILVLNVLHHIQDLHAALGNISQAGNLVVFEIPTKQENAIVRALTKAGFQPMQRLSSHRDERLILILANNQNQTALFPRASRRYSYNYWRARSLKIIRNILIWPLRLPWRFYRRIRNYLKNRPGM